MNTGIPIRLDDRLRANFNRHRDTLQQLADALREEQQTLVSDDVEALESLTARKAAAAEELRALCNELGQLHGQKNRSFLAWLAAQPGGSALASEWQAILDLALRCQQGNAENAAMLDARHRQVRAKLQVLRGETQPTTYGPRTGAAYGGDATAFSSRTLGLA